MPEIVLHGRLWPSFSVPARITFHGPDHVTVTVDGTPNEQWVVFDVFADDDGEGHIQFPKDRVTVRATEPA